LAAPLLRQQGRWAELRWLLAAAPRLSPALQVEAGWLALHDNEPAAALRAVGGQVPGAGVRAWAKHRLGDLPGALEEAAAAADGPAASPLGLAGLFQAAEEVPAARPVALAKLTALATAGQLGPRLLKVLEHLLEKEYGAAGAARQLAKLASGARASWPLVARAAQALVRQGQLPEALNLLEQARQRRPAEKTWGLACLAWSGRLCLEAGQARRAADYLAEAAALVGEPKLVAYLSALAHGGELSAPVQSTLVELAEAWAEGKGGAQSSCGLAMLHFLSAVAPREEVEAWVRSHGKAADGAVVAGA
jgi:tetratricopeptide (TPR) repeat protein